MQNEINEGNKISWAQEIALKKSMKFTCFIIYCWKSENTFHQFLKASFQSQNIPSSSFLLILLALAIISDTENDKGVLNKKCRVKLNISLRQRNNNSDNYGNKYLKIRVNSDEEIPSEETLTLYLLDLFLMIKINTIL